MTKSIDFTKYTEFVNGVTSSASNNTSAFIDRIKELQDKNPEINIALWDTAATGMCGETGEFSEILKKAKFHGKEVTNEVLAHAVKELGDVIWYWTNACRALGVDPNQVIADNVSKLESRYPGGHFDTYYSENRSAGDI